MSRIRLEKHPIFALAENAVYDSQLCAIFWIAAQLANDLDEKGVLHAPLDSAELALWSDKHEIVSMHYATKTSMRMLVPTRAGQLTDKTHCCALNR